MISRGYAVLRSFTPVPEILPIEFLLPHRGEHYPSLIYDPNWPVYYEDKATIPDHLHTKLQLEASGFRLAPGQQHRGIYCPTLSMTTSIQSGTRSWLLYDLAEAIYDPNQDNGDRTSNPKPQAGDLVLGRQTQPNQPHSTDLVLGGTKGGNLPLTNAQPSISASGMSDLFTV